jgi:STE24 endopeptidase
MTETNRDTIYDDPTQRDRAIRYSRTKEWLVLVGAVWSALVNLAALMSGASARLRHQAERRAPGRLGPVMPYALVGTIASFLASLPLSYYGSYVIEHRYDLSDQKRRGWMLDQLKGLGVGLVLGLPLLQGIYWIIRRFPRWWWAILSGLTIPFTAILVNLAPVLILPLFNKYEPLRDQSLVDRIKKLAAGQGVNVSAVLQMDMSKQTKKPNAFFTGLGNTKRIVLADTLLENFTPDEIEVILAHELAHQVHRDLWKGMAMAALGTVITSFGVYRLAPLLIDRFGRKWGLDQKQGVEDVAAMPLLTLLTGALSLGMAPAFNSWVRRFVEHAADRYSLELTHRPDDFISAMEKLGRLSLADPAPPAIVKHFLYDHPPIQERIDYGKQQLSSGRQN